MRFARLALVCAAFVLLCPPVALVADEDAEAIQESDALYRAALDAFRRGHYAEAAERARRSLELREKADGPRGGPAAQATGLLGAALMRQGRFDEGEPLLERALSIREELHGPDSPRVAAALNNLGELYRQWRAYEKARPYYERAIAIWGADPDPGSAERLATCLPNLADVERRLDRLEEGQGHCERALELWGVVGKPDHPMAGVAWGNLGTIHSARLDPERALECHERAYAIWLKAYGEEHPWTAMGLGNVAYTLHTLGHDDRATPLYERSLALQEKRLGPDHPQLTHALEFLARAYQQTGDVARSRRYRERAAAILEAKLGKEHPETANALGRLAMTLLYLGLPDQGAVLLDRALAIQRKHFGERHGDIGFTLNRLGRIRHAQGRLDEARAYYEEALEVRTALLGEDDLVLAESLNDLGAVHWQQDRLDLAAAMQVRALALRREGYGEAHHSVGESLLNLGAVRARQGRLEEALDLFDEAARVLEETLGRDNRLTVHVWSNRANALEALGRVAEAREAMATALDRAERRIRRDLVGLEGRERFEAGRSARRQIDDWVRLTGRLGETGYPEVLRFKGLVTRVEGAERRRALAGSEEALSLRRRLREAESRHAALANDLPFGTEERRQWQRAFARASQQREQLSRELAATFGSLEVGTTTVEALQGSLSAGEVFVDVFRTKEQYLAWIVPPRGSLQRVVLGDADGIDRAAEAYVTAAAKAEAPAALESTGRELARLVIRPIDERLPDGARRLIICPDAAMATIPFAALPVGSGAETVIDRMRVAYVTMAQDLVAAPSSGATGSGALLAGGVDYDSARSITDEERRSRGWVEGLSDEIAAAGTRAPGGRTFRDLPATRREVQGLTERFGAHAEVLLAGEATEGRLRRLAPGRRVLHLATHGFVRTSLLRSLRPSRREPRWLGGAAERHLVSTDPRLLSGLALAGANSRDGADGDDGILTALEVSRMDLSAAELVVLSACETARGKPESGEGVLGLVQGFWMAGAGQVVASLWAVDDEATALLMDRFYEGLLREQDPLSPPDALREAALFVRGASGRGGRSFAAPRYWAAFVAYGR